MHSRGISTAICDMKLYIALPGLFDGVAIHVIWACTRARARDAFARRLKSLKASSSGASCTTGGLITSLSALGIASEILRLWGPLPFACFWMLVSRLMEKVVYSLSKLVGYFSRGFATKTQERRRRSRVD